MKGWWALVCLGFLGCMRVPVDPLAAARVEQKVAEAAPLPQGWASQATVLIGGQMLDRLLEEATLREMKRALKPNEFRVLGMDVRLDPEMHLESFTLRGVDVCESCFQADLSVTGTETVTMTNRTGTMTKPVGWSAGITAVFDVQVSETRSGARKITVGFAQGDAWSVEFALKGVPPEVQAMMGPALTKAVQKLLAKPKLPRIPVVRLGGDAPVPFAGVRVRRAQDAIAVELAFQSTGMGEVGALPDVQEHWAVVVPSQTVLGLMQAAALRQPIPDGPVVPMMESLSLHEDRFDLGIAVWPRTKKPKARHFMVFGTVAKAEDGRLHLEADRAEVVRGKGPTVDLATLLFKKKILRELESRLSATVPLAVEEESGRMIVSVQVDEVRARAQTLEMVGTLSVSEAAGPPETP